MQGNREKWFSDSKGVSTEKLGKTLLGLHGDLKEILDICVKADPAHPHITGLVVALDVIDRKLA